MTKPFLQHEVSEMMSPKVSVIVPAYNAGEFLKESIDSVLIQTMEDFELLIVDDGSTDDTYKIATGYQDDPRIIVLRKPNGGLSSARNFGIERSRGEYVTYHDADDIYEPEYLQICVDFLEKNPDVSIVFTDAVYFGESKYAGRRFQEVYPPNPPITFAKAVSRVSSIGGFATFRRDVISRVGLFDYIYGAEDLDYWLRALHAGCRIEALPEMMCRYRRHSSAISMGGLDGRRGIIELLRKWRNNPELTPEELEAVESYYKETQWRLDIGEAFAHVHSKDYGLAMEKFRKASQYRSRLRYKLARMALEIAPNVLRGALRFRLPI
jgi:glycosyltransferase involved in cell wall biosynthesis